MIFRQTLGPFFCALCLCCSLDAQSFQFHSGPSCLISQIAHLDDHIFLGTACGLYRSYDKGHSWDYVSTIGDNAIDRIRVADDSSIWIQCTTEFNGPFWGNTYQTVWRSTDKGNTFQEKDKRQMGQWSTTGGYLDRILDFYALDNNTAFCLIRAEASMGNYPKILSTKTGGSSWESNFFNTIVASDGHYFQVPILVGDTLFWIEKNFNAFSTRQNPFYLDSLMNSAPLSFVPKFKIQLNGNIIVTAPNGQFWGTNDGCKTWHLGQPGSAYTVANIEALDSTFLVATNMGILEGRFDGQQFYFEEIWNPQNKFSAVQQAFFIENDLFFLKDGLFFKSDTIQQDIDHLSKMGQPKGTFSPFSSTDFLYKIDNWVFKGTNAKDWELFDVPSDNGRVLSSFYPFDNHLILAKTDIKIYLSKDDGVSFDPIATLISSSSKPFLPNLRNDEIFIKNTSYFTIDTGKTWVEIANPRNILQANGDTLLAGDGISFDHGNTWSDFLNAPGPKLGFTGGYLVCAADSRAWASRDLGMTWEVLGGVGLGPDGEVHVLHPDVVFIEAASAFLWFDAKNFQIVNISTPAETKGYQQGIPFVEFGDFYLSGSTIYSGNIRGVWRLPICTFFDSFFSETVKICPGQNHVFFGDTLSTEGTFLHIDSSEICDKRYTLNLEFERYEAEETIYFCIGDSVLVDSVYYHSAIDLSKQYNTTEGCDSTHIIHVREMPIISAVLEESICYGDTVWYNGIAYTTPTVDTLSFTAENGCDSNVVLIVDIPFFYDTILVNTTFCEGGKYTFNGLVFTEPGTYFVDVPFGNCLKAYRFNIEVRPDVLIQIDTAVALNSIILGVPISQDTSFTVLHSYQNNCDTIFAVNAMLTSPTSASIQASTLRLFPNPNDGFFYVQSRESIESIEVYSLSGQKMLGVSDIKPENKIDCGSLSAGVYMVKIWTESGLAIRRILKF